MTDVYISSTSNNKMVRMYVKYEGENKEVPYYVFVGAGEDAFAKKVYVIKKNDYKIIKANDHAVTMKTKSELTLAEYKELVRKYVGDAEADATTEIPGNWTTDNATGNKVWQALCEETKYQDVMNLKPITLDNLLNGNVDESKLASVYQEVATVVPSASGAFATMRRHNTKWVSDYDSNVSKMSLPVDSSKKVEHIKIDSSLVSPASAILGGGGFNQITDWNQDIGMLMLSYNGSNTITKDGEEYVMFAIVTRQCADTMLFGATVTNAKTTKDQIAELNEELKAIDVATITEEECEALRDKIAELKAVSSYITDDDFDTSKLEEAEERIKAEKLSGSIYAPIEMEMFMDVFGTVTETRTYRKDYENNPYMKYVGYNGTNTNWPTAFTKNASVFSAGKGTNTSWVELSETTTLENGRHIFEIGGVKFRLGEITEGKVDGNAFMPGAIYKTENYRNNPYVPDFDENNYYISKNEKAGTTTINAGTFPVNVGKVDSINVLVSTLPALNNAALRPQAVEVRYKEADAPTEFHLLMVGNINKLPEEAMVYIPSDKIEAVNSIETLMENKLELTGYSINDVTFPSDSELTWKNYGITHKYTSFILPENTKVLATADRYDKTYAGYVNNFEIPVNPNYTVESISFTTDGSGNWSQKYTPNVGGYAEKNRDNINDATGEAYKTGEEKDGIMDSVGTDADTYIPVTLKGFTGGQVYVRTSRNCSNSVILGMTAEITGTKFIEKLNNLMANATVNDIATIEAMKAFIDGEVVTYADLDAASVAAYEAVRQNANLAGTIELVEEEGSMSVKAELFNVAKLAGKKYTLIVAFYDKDENLIKAVPQVYTSTADKTFSQILTVNNVPENTAAVKGFIWKDFDTMLPLGTKAE